MLQRPLALSLLLLLAGPLMIHPADARPTKKVRAAAKIEVQGHRGARALRPENTIAAFDYALKVGVDVLELDLVVTKDDRLVVSHDPLLNPKICLGPKGEKITSSSPIRTLTLAQVKTFDCGSLKNPRFERQRPSPGARIPGLEEVLQHVKASKSPAAQRVEFNIEAKTVPGHPELAPSAERFARLIVQTLEAQKLLSRSIVQSFDHRVLKAVKSVAPRLRIAALMSDTRPDYVAVARSLNAEIVSPNQHWITREDVRDLHAAGVRVVPWTANTETDWQRLKDLGVDGIITDDPAGLIAFLTRKPTPE